MKELQMTLTKTKTYSLKPFGRFWIKWSAGEQALRNPKIIDFASLRIDHSTGMPYSKDQEKEFCKFMIKNHTDILTDDSNFYTRVGDNWTEVNHPKLQAYKTFLWKKELEDNKENWDTYLESL